MSFACKFKMLTKVRAQEQTKKVIEDVYTNTATKTKVCAVKKVRILRNHCVK